MSSFVEKFIAKEAKSLFRSLLQTGAKKGIKTAFSKVVAKSQSTIESDMIRDIGYITTHYTLKDNEVQYTPSVMFFQEWLAKSSFIDGKIFRDEENGKVYFKNEVIDELKKVQIIDEFIKQTKTKSTKVLHSYFDNALKYVPIIDRASGLFLEEFSGWDINKESVIDTFLINLYGDALESNKEYATNLFKKWIVGTARRAIEPGVAFDGCLVLQGPPGVGKTSLVRELLPSPLNNRTGEVYCNIKNPQKFVETMIGKTITCFDELSSLDAPKVQETFKQLLSSRFIDVRLPWRRNPERFLLRSGFCATTNKEKFIKDAALSRRLWTIKLNSNGRINHDYLQKVRKELWKEALYLAKNNFSYLLSQEEQKLIEENNKEFLKL